MLFLWTVYIHAQLSGTWGSSGIQLLKCGRLVFLCSQTTASSSVVVTEVQPFDRCTSGPPESALTLYTDTSLTGWGAFLKGRTVLEVWEDCHLEEDINLLKMRAALLSLRHFQLFKDSFC